MVRSVLTSSLLLCSLLTWSSLARAQFDHAQYDRIFSWAEQRYPELLFPAAPPSQDALGYRYRYYSGSQSYVGFKDGKAWFLAVGMNEPLNLGDAGGYLDQADAVLPLQLTSSAFAEGEAIPVEHTCDGADQAPPLSWRGRPMGTKSWALIVDDPDAPDPAAPRMTWVHWLVWNLPARGDTLLAAQLAKDAAGSDVRQGTTDFGRIGYGGPCPPIGTHRYYFRLYALDTVLDLPAGATRTQLEAAMKTHILGQTTLMGRYSSRR